MSRVYKNIISLSLLFAGLIMLAHPLIPHDHHYNFSELQEHKHSNDGPSHCLSFNELHINKLRTTGFIKNIKIFPVNAVEVFSHLSTINPFIPAIKINGIETHFLDYSVFIPISPTRGSPLV